MRGRSGFSLEPTASGSEEVRAELYKLLIYDTGSFFLSHRDSEKAPGMFATLVLTLPSEYAGGELVIRHKGQEARLDLQRDDPAEAACAAFYADCRHEVRPVESGHRLALIYNLVRPNGEPLPRPPDWQRAADIRCPCADCGALNRFLGSATEATWQLKAAEPKRRHVAHSIQTHRCDLDTRTDKTGRPYTLVCTKNQASYDRRVQQRRKDLQNRARLTGERAA